jgi:hypothetical protein
MPKILIIGNESYEVPNEGEGGNYGQSVTDYLEAVARALGTVQAPNDIPVTTASILNNISTPTPILGFSFNTTEVISINAEYIIRRTTDSSSSVSSGVIRGNYNGTDWRITIESEGESGVELDINSSGQIIYTSSDIPGSSYVGEIRFKAKVFNDIE